MRILFDLGEALVGFQRIATGGDEIEDGVEIQAREAGIGRGASHLGIEFIGKERLSTGRTEDVLREHVQGPHTCRGVLRVLGEGAERRGAFEHFEAVRRNEHAFRGLIHAVIGAADALQETRGTLGSADIDNEIDVAPVDTKIERGGGNDRAQMACCHRRLDLTTLRHIEGTVMKRNREPIVVDAPKFLEIRSA